MNKSLLLALFCLVLAFDQAHAKKAYIRDVLVVGLRPEPLDTSVPFRTLKSGDKLEVAGQGGGWAKVTTEDGSTGFVAEKNLVETEPVSFKLKLAEEKIAELSARPQGAGSPAMEELSARVETLAKENAALKAGGDSSASALKSLEALKAENERLREELKNKPEPQEGPGLFSSESRVTWFLAGSFAVFMGWLLGKFGAGKRRGSSGYY